MTQSHSPSDDGSAPSFAPGEIVAGRYRIESQIGEGGFGAVFRATQMNLGRQVALKVLLPHLIENEDGLGRFKREAELAQRLEHPNTVRLFDFGIDGKTPFIAFELLNGQPLDAVIRSEGALGATRVARIGTQVLKSLMEAHAKGIVHRDIKPSNIFLCSYAGESDFVKVLDFGIAKATSSGSGAGQTRGVTKAGEAVGTPAYMSPEQVTGTSVTPATDLYALGLVLAEALSGEVVMKGESGMQIVMAQISQNAVPLVPHVLQSPLGPVVHRATQKAADRRYASAAEMLAHVEQAMKTAPSISVRPPSAASAPAPPRDLGYLQTNVIGAAPPPAPPAAGYGSYAPPQATPPGSGYAPQWGSVAPGPSNYVPAPAFSGTKKGSDGTGCGIVALLSGIGLLVVGIIVVLIMAVGLSPSTTVSGTGGTTGSGRPVVSGRKFAEMGVEDLKARIEAAGWTVVNESVSRGSNVETIQIAISRGQLFGAVQHMKYGSDTIAESVRNSFDSNDNGAAARDGGVVLVVMVFQNNKREARDLLDTLMR